MKRGWVLFLAAGSLISSSFADEARTFRREDRVLIAGSSCSELRTHAEAFQKIPRVKDSRAVTIAIPECVKSSDGESWEIDVSDFVPVWARASEEEIECEGPNCFNMALLTVGLNDRPRFCSADEFTACLKSPACKPVPAGERLRPGDVLTLRVGTNDIHGMIYVDDDFVISRNGARFRTPETHGAQRMEDVFSKENYFLPDRKCWPRQGTLPRNSEGCRIRLAAHRCDGGINPFSEIEKDRELAKHRDTFRRAECAAYRNLIFGNRTVLEGLQNAALIDALEATRSSLLEAQKKESDDKRAEELKLLRLQTTSLLRWLQDRY